MKERPVRCNLIRAKTFLDGCGFESDVQYDRIRLMVLRVRSEWRIARDCWQKPNNIALICAMIREDRSTVTSFRVAGVCKIAELTFQK